MHQHFESRRAARRGPAGEESGGQGSHGQAPRQDLAGPGFARRHRLSDQGGPAARTGEAQFLSCRLRLHDLHRQRRSARPGHRGSDHEERPHLRGRAVGQPQFRGAHPSEHQGELPGLAAAGRRLCHRRPGQHRHDERTARHRQRRHSRLSCATSGPRPRRSARSCNTRPTRRPTGASTATSPRTIRCGTRSRRRPARSYTWDTSTYIAEPPFFDGLHDAARRDADDSRRARAGNLRRFGDDRPHQPGGLDQADVAGGHLSAGTRRRRAGFQQLRQPARQPRGHDARHVRQRAHQEPDAARQGRWFARGGRRHACCSPTAGRCRSTTRRWHTSRRGTPTVVFAGEEYGTGSSRDWAAKGTQLLGVKAVIARSFERIHRSNLVGMGVLPCQFKGSDSVASLRHQRRRGIRHRRSRTGHQAADGRRH